MYFTGVELRLMLVEITFKARDLPISTLWQTFLIWHVKSGRQSAEKFWISITKSGVSQNLFAITQQHNNHCLSHLFSGRKRGIRFAWETPPSSPTTVIFWGLNRWISHVLLLEETPLSRNMCGYPILTDRQTTEFRHGEEVCPLSGQLHREETIFHYFWLRHGVALQRP